MRRLPLILCSMVFVGLTALWGYSQIGRASLDWSAPSNPFRPSGAFIPRTKVVHSLWWVDLERDAVDLHWGPLPGRGTRTHPQRLYLALRSGSSARMEDERSIAGFDYEQRVGFNRTIRRVRVPLYFPTLVFGLLGFWLWRRQRRRSGGKGFEVQARMDPEGSPMKSPTGSPG